jgi:drug/metabolite transporter (DMT)-like permease
MNKKTLKWVLLIGASLIWGTAFLWTKKSLAGLTPLQSAMGRVAVAGLVFLILGRKYYFKLPRKMYLKFLVNGLLGTSIPIFLFSVAQTELDSGITAVFNSVTPLFVLLIAFFFLKQPVSKRQTVGVVLGFLAATGLIFVSSGTHPGQDYTYAGLIFLAALSYGIDLNLIKLWYKDVPVLVFTSGIFITILPLVLTVLVVSGLTGLDWTDGRVQTSFAYVVLVGITGSVIAKLMFNKLIQIDTPVFASTVTYLIPLVAVSVGILDGESIHLLQVALGAVLLYAIYLSGGGG